MSQPVVITSRLLMEAGGWKEMKEARRLHEAGKVEEARYENGVVEGLVRDGSRAYRVRLTILSPTNMENECACPRARREGILCGHALAAALETIDPRGGSDSGEDKEKTEPAAASRETRTRISEAWPKLTEVGEEDAVPAELFVVLAPNLASAWEKGRITVGIDAKVDGVRQLLRAVKPGVRLFLDAADVALFRFLQTVCPEEAPGMMLPDRSQFLDLLETLAGHPRVTLGKKQPARVGYEPVRLPIVLAGEDRVAIEWPGDGVVLAGESACWIFRGGHFQPVAPGLPAALREIFERGLALDSPDAAAKTEALAFWFDVDPEVTRQLPETVAPAVELELEGSLNHLEARLFFRYGNRRYPAGGERAGVFADPKSPDRKLTGDPRNERAIVDAITRWGFEGPDRMGKLILKDKARILRFLAHGYHRLDEDWKITTGPRFEHAGSQVEPVAATFDFQSSGENWFAMEVEFGTPSGAVLSRNEILQLLQKGQNHKPVKGGKIAVIDDDSVEEIQDAISDCDPAQDQPGAFRIDNAHAGYLRETASDAGIACRGGAPWKSVKAKQATRPIPEELKKILRPYQAEGAKWLLGLAGRGMGGILADDMGLGKTVQTLAFLKSIGGPSLVVCPSSLVHNWVAEAKKFTPDLEVVAMDGPDRAEKWARHAGADVFVTSYALLRRDEEEFRRRTFVAAILDEAQHIKNPDAQVSKAAHRIRASHRFALTGTPIENSVRDLWAVLQFAQPGYLGSRKAFAERFEKPIASGGLEGPRRRLARRLRPVILRRLKSEVATDLPERIEQVIYCELTDTQKSVYDQILRQSRESILDAEGGRQRMLALTALLRLRQVCCDLRLLKLPNLKENEASVKLDTLRELLDEAVEGGHRVLVFSQFVEMLQVLVPVLMERGLKYCYLDGQTRRRGDVVARFQESEDIPVFLISLKAGGVGLNLTGADTVIHVDPWWNPAIEAQATDRAHRIGQTRVVTSYKLITRGTVEEKILALQEKKKATIAAMLDRGGAAGEAGLSEAEILGLLE